jgi:hypothetical protein
MAADLVIPASEYLHVIPGEKLRGGHVQLLSTKRLDSGEVLLLGHWWTYEEASSGAIFPQYLSRPKAALETIIKAEGDVGSVDSARPDARHGFGIADELVSQGHLLNQAAKSAFFIFEDVMQIEEMDSGTLQAAAKDPRCGHEGTGTGESHMASERPGS